MTAECWKPSTLIFAMTASSTASAAETSETAETSRAAAIDRRRTSVARQLSPRVRRQVAEDGRLPSVLRVRFQVRGCVEAHTARVADRARERHPCSEGGVGGLVLDGACDPVRRLPGANYARRPVDVAEESPLAR